MPACEVAIGKLYVAVPCQLRRCSSGSQTGSGFGGRRAESSYGCRGCFVQGCFSAQVDMATKHVKPNLSILSVVCVKTSAAKLWSWVCGLGMLVSHIASLQKGILLQSIVASLLLLLCVAKARRGDPIWIALVVEHLGHQSLDVREATASSEVSTFPALWKLRVQLSCSIGSSEPPPRENPTEYPWSAKSHFWSAGPVQATVLGRL